MKKILAVALCLAIITSLVGCGSRSRNLNNTSSELSPKEKYDDAIALFNEKKYAESIDILENINYENSKELEKQISYIYACELFNKQEFSSAYNYFNKSENHLDSQKNKNMSAYYQGIKLVNNEQHWKSIDWFRKVLNDDEFKSSAEKHIIKITTSLIGNAWFGSYTNGNGATLQIEFKYFENNDNLYIAHVDKSNGYKQVASINGSLEVGAEKSKYYHSETTFGGTWDAVEFSFDSANRMYVYCSAKSIGDKITGFYSAKYTPTVYYKIENENYPTLTIPEIDNDGVVDNNLEDNTDVSSTESIVTSSDSDSNVNSNTGNVSKPNNTNSKPNNTNSKPNNSNNNTNSKPSNSNTHTHSYSNATCTKPATCSCGATIGSASGHNWQDATCTKPKVCNYCSATEGTALGHRYDTNGKLSCSRCFTANPDVPTNASDFTIVYKSKTSTYNGCTVEIKDCYFEKLNEFFTGYARIGINVYVKTSGSVAAVLIKWYDKNGNYLDTTTPQLRSALGLQIGESSLGGTIPIGAKKIEIYDISEEN